ncbi:MAG: Maf family protein [Clostridiales bacterium]|nr:Maf family protein [Clostridiales bacterium]
MKYSNIDVIFATASPRRRALAYNIKYIGLTERKGEAPDFPRVKPIFISADVEETAVGTAHDVATANARLKGEWAAARHDLPIFAFDTVVGIDDEVFGKPKTAEEAVNMFKRLCGRTHEVITAVYFRNNGKIIEKSEKTSVTFSAFNRELVYNYVDSGAPFDKAGGYNIDDAAIKPLIAGVAGEYENVVGLPVALTEKLIEENLIYGENGYSH